MTDMWDDDDLGEMAIPSFMFTAAPFITPFHPFSIFVQRVSDPLKAFAELRYEDRRGEDKRQIQGYLGSISDVEATPEDRTTALKGLLELCAKGSSNFVIESVLDDEDALPTIIEDIQNEEEDETIKFLSTELLHVVATANYVDVYQTGGLPAVLSVLKTENTKVLHSALLSLQHITQLGSACAECFKCNVVQYCVHLMHKRSIDVLLTASHILHNLLIEHADPHAALSDCRKLTSERYFCEIVRVVDEQHEKLEPASKIGKGKKKEAKASNSLSLQSQKVLTSVLAILAGSDESCYINLQEEDIKRLVDMLSYKNVRDVVVNACTIIQALLHNKRVKFEPNSKIAENLVEQTLVLTKAEPAPTAAVVLLTQLIHQRMLKSEDIIKRDVGKLLVAHLKSKNEETSVAAARGITYLCSPSIVDGPDFKGTSKIHKSVAPFLEPIVRQLLGVVKGTLEGTELRPASVMCAGLAAIAQHEAGRRAMMKQPVLESLCSLMAKSGADQVEKEAASLAILNLSKVGKAIDPVGNPAHKEALKQLSTQLHSKNHHIQACVITAFLTLAKDGVKPDCIYGKNLEQLKTTRVNSNVARELYQALTNDKSDELTEELDPSAATKHKGTPTKKKKGAKPETAAPASPKRRNGASTHETNGPFDTHSEVSEQSDSDDGGGGNNMFSALGKKKKKKEDDRKGKDPPGAKKKCREEEERKRLEEVRRKEAEREALQKEKKRKKLEQKQREKEQREQQTKKLKEQQLREQQQREQQKQEVERKKAQAVTLLTCPEGTPPQDDKVKKKREKIKPALGKREEEEVRRGPPTTQAPVGKGQRRDTREKHEPAKKIEMTPMNNDYDKKQVKANGPATGQGAISTPGQAAPQVPAGQGSTWAQRLSPSKTVPANQAPAPSASPSSTPARVAASPVTAAKVSTPATVPTTAAPTATVAPPAASVTVQLPISVAPTPLAPPAPCTAPPSAEAPISTTTMPGPVGMGAATPNVSPAVTRGPPPLKRVSPPPGLTETLKQQQQTMTQRGPHSMAPGVQTIVLQEANEGSGIQIESLVEKLNNASVMSTVKDEVPVLLDSDYMNRMGVLGSSIPEKDKIVSPPSKIKDTSLLNDWALFSNPSGMDGHAIGPTSPIGAKDQAGPFSSSQPPELVQFNRDDMPIGGAATKSNAVGAQLSNDQWQQAMPDAMPFVAHSLFSDLIPTAVQDQKQRSPQVQRQQQSLLQVCFIAWHTLHRACIRIRSAIRDGIRGKGTSTGR
eukprot:TRINITY_DN1117_c0_g1_i2.p1 TRINITY_DN1117_c0_g1~~TRINITY_DN1117_c0_g1_i2.p1  ORF type:complete len:1352 (+),score=321.39 TRINITY_DN1117_c0_g1_i2:302-4057(+)